MVKIEWTKQAIENSYAIREYYLEVSPKFADKISDQIFSKETLLAEFPRLRRMVPELNNESVKEISFKQYRIIYFSLMNH
jgi:plasmid stabilization system protein ParE